MQNSVISHELLTVFPKICIYIFKKKKINKKQKQAASMREYLYYYIPILLEFSFG